MNALHPPQLSEPTAVSLSFVDAPGAARLVSRMAALYFAVSLVLLSLLAGLPDLRNSGLGAVAAASVLLPLAGLLATRPLAASRAGNDFSAVSAPRWRRGSRAPIDPLLRLGRLARRPQAVIVPALALCAIVLVWWLSRAGQEMTARSTVFGMAAMIAGFPLLVAERIMTSVSRASLPEAPGLQRLLFIPMLLIPLAGLIEIAAGLGAGIAPALMAALDIYIGVVAVELIARASANWFLPPPSAEAARAAVDSAVALLLQPRRLAPDGLAAPLRNHFGLDFSRSWALRFSRTAAVPIALVLALVAWGLTGVSLIDLDQRGIYERLGAPVAVWSPGAHVGLPWPLGRVRRVDLGTVHAVLLSGNAVADARSPAEAPPPLSVDRLWDQAHPSEVSYLIASRQNDGREGFQAVSLDLRVLYRIGLDDRAALRAAYAVSSPDLLVRAETGRLMARVFAGQELPGVLGEGRETMAEALRARLQAELDRFGSGIELLSVVIEAIHPPAGAAEAYHNVQAAEIIANTAIDTERGRALATAARARQEATSLTMTASGAAADTVGQANVAARAFAADQDAWKAGGSAFVLERYFFNLSLALAKSPLVILDHRLTGRDAPAIDLRSFGAPTPRPPADD